ncbi:hypothetical protein GCM10007916_04240 [Psychromonas marina]|uniref:Uncharacterized protein n=1 Tax=Psychromonas marina TaxID=88364 RepID=A0ABQ6DW37_9GAMM|nr:hypothetical protein [Psychromonas marina]GLS89357.1 hypothetical protein GCM10007916_04240 [Psychromonas marina]
MKKSMGLLTSALFASLILITPVSANNGNKHHDKKVLPEQAGYAACNKPCSDRHIIIPEPNNRKR